MGSVAIVPLLHEHLALGSERSLAWVLGLIAAGTDARDHGFARISRVSRSKSRCPGKFQCSR